MKARSPKTSGLDRPHDGVKACCAALGCTGWDWATQTQTRLCDALAAILRASTISAPIAPACPRVAQRASCDIRRQWPASGTRGRRYRSPTPMPPSTGSATHSIPARDPRPIMRNHGNGQLDCRAADGHRADISAVRRGLDAPANRSGVEAVEAVSLSIPIWMFVMCSK
jgi:hypothetical protein